MILRSIILNVILIIGLYKPAFTNNEQEICLTPTCVDTAKEILEGLDNRTDPCDNFYQFACGNAIKKIIIPADSSFIDTFETIRTKVNEQLKDILSEPIASYETRAISLIKKYYQACMNEDYIEEHGVKKLTDLLKELGGWPVLEEDTWKGSNFTWTNLLIKFKKLGLGITSFIEMTVDPDLKNSSKYTIQLDQLQPGLQRHQLVTRTKLKPYLDLMVNVSVELGANRTRAQKELNESLEFEIKLAGFSLSPEDRHDITKLLNYMTIKELKKKFPKIPWLEYINGLLPSEVQIRENDTVLVIVPSYFSSLEKLIEDTPKRVLANYAISRAVVSMISYLPKRIYRHYQTASQLLDGQSERPARWKECSKTAHDSLPLLASSLYVRKYFDKDAKRKTVEMVKYIKDSFVEILKNLEWMDETTRQKALDKANRIVDHVGYPDELLNDELLDQYYKELEVDENSYLKSSLNLTIHSTNIKFKKLRSAVNKTDWTKHADVADVGAANMLLENSIVLPAGILQGIFFNKNRPNYMNFGAIGSVIAHEVTHGFDDTGKTFNADGNIANWWAAETETKFKNKTQCMIHQYGNYTVQQVNKTINGLRTIDENIADNGGIKEAYYAYNQWVKVNGTEPRLPGLNFLPNQLFWISVARNWCAKYKDEYLETVVAVDLHSPNEFRVIGPFSNSKDFATDFKCAVGSKMNPIKKCTIW